MIYSINIPRWLDMLIRQKTRISSYADILIDDGLGSNDRILLFSMFGEKIYNSLSILDFIKLAYERGVYGKIIFLSSYMVYGSALNQTRTIKETVCPHPRDRLSTINLSIESALEYMSGKYGIYTYVLRLFTVYSPFQPLNYVIPWIVYSVLTDKTILIGDVEKVRDFIYVSDVIEVINKIEKESVINQNNHFIQLNVGTGKGRAIRDVIEIVEEIIGKKADVIFDATKIRDEFDPDYAVADISRIENILGWKPKVPLEEGISYVFNEILSRSDLNV